MKKSAWTLILLLLTLGGTFALGTWALASRNRELLLLALPLLGLSTVLLLVFFQSASNCHCPLCRMRILLRSGCQRSAKAERTLGSYRLRVASRIVTTGSFRCPYCGESTRCQLSSPQAQEKSQG